MSAPIDRPGPASASGRIADSAGSTSLARSVMTSINDRVLTVSASVASASQIGGTNSGIGRVNAGDAAGASIGRGADVYDLAPIAREIGATLAGSPLEQAGVAKGLAEFASAAATRAIGLAGIPMDQQRAAVERLLPEPRDTSLSAFVAALSEAARRLLA